MPNELALTTLTEANAILWSDATLFALRSGEDLDIFFDLQLGSVDRQLGTDRVTLRTTWAHSLDIDMVWGRKRPRHGGAAMAFEINFTREDDMWSVRFDFADHGTIGLRCAELFVTPTTIAAS